MAKTRDGHARWEGGIGGTGTMRTASGTIESEYTAHARFEGDEGTNPEEVIGAAHAACFSMALSGILEKAGNTPEWIETDAKVTIKQVGEGWEITDIALETEASVPGISADEFAGHAEAAKAGCPVSKALAGPEITLEASLAG